MSAITPSMTDSSETPRNRRIIQVVARNTAFMLAAQIVIKILALMFNIYVVRRLGAAHYGRYAAALAYVGIFAMFADLGTSTLSVREMARDESNIARMTTNVMGLRAILSLITIVIITVSAWLLGKTSDMIWGILIGSCSLLLYAYEGPLECVIISRERLDLSSILQVLNQFVFIVLGTGLLLVGAGYIGLLSASLVGVVAMGFVATVMARRLWGLTFRAPDSRQWKPLLVASAPFAWTGVVSTLVRRFDTVFMSFVLTDEVVGWYNVPYNLMAMVLLLAQSLAMSIFPTLVREYDSGRNSIQDTVQRALRYLLLLSLPVSIGGTLLADLIIEVLYEVEFVPSVLLMRIMIWALPALFMVEVLGRTSSTMHLEKKVAKIAGFLALFSVVLNLILIPTLGALGAAIVMVVTSFADMVVSSLIIGPALVWKGNVWPLLRIVAAGGMMGGGVWAVRSLMPALDLWLELIVLVAVGIVLYALAAYLLGAISPGELKWMQDSVRRKLLALRQGRLRTV